MPRESNQTALATHGVWREPLCLHSGNLTQKPNGRRSTALIKKFWSGFSTLRGRLFRRTTLFEIWIETRNCNPPCAKASSCWLPRASVGYFADSC